MGLVVMFGRHGAQCVLYGYRFCLMHSTYERSDYRAESGEYITCAVGFCSETRHCMERFYGVQGHVQPTHARTRTSSPISRYKTQVEIKGSVLLFHEIITDAAKNPSNGFQGPGLTF